MMLLGKFRRTVVTFWVGQVGLLILVGGILAPWTGWYAPGISLVGSGVACIVLRGNGGGDGLASTFGSLLWTGVGLLTAVLGVVALGLALFFG